MIFFDDDDDMKYYLYRYGPYLEENNRIMQGGKRKFQCMGCIYDNMWSPLDLERGVCLECLKWQEEWKVRLAIKMEERKKKYRGK